MFEHRFARQVGAGGRLANRGGERAFGGQQGGLDLGAAHIGAEVQRLHGLSLLIARRRGFFGRAAFYWSISTKNLLLPAG